MAQLVLDRQLGAIEQHCGLNPTEAAALVTIYNVPGQPIDFLHRAVNRSHSATVRLISKLEAAGLVTRGDAEDGRAVSLELTGAGEKKVIELLEARGAALRRCLAYLTQKEERKLDELLAKMLAASVVDEQHAYQICRLCNGDECDVCPVEAALVE